MNDHAGRKSACRQEMGNNEFCWSGLILHLPRGGSRTYKGGGGLTQGTNLLGRGVQSRSMLELGGSGACPPPGNLKIIDVKILQFEMPLGRCNIRPLQQNSLFPISCLHADFLPAWSFIITVNIHYLSCDCIDSIAKEDLQRLNEI